MRAGVQIMDPGAGAFDLSSPRAVAAVKLLADMNQIDHSITPGFLAYTFSDCFDLFCRNKVAMSIEGPWSEEEIEVRVPGKEFYYVPVPVPDDMIDRYKEMPSLQDMVMYPINARSKHLAETWDFLKYIRRDEADTLYIDRMTGGLPTTLYVLNSANNAKRIGWDVFENQIHHSMPWPAHPQIIAIAKNMLTPYTEKAIVGEMSPQAAMDETVREAQALIQEGK
jgi:ABC-type glycerol-3-phosphate transport system substrate-binding protein